MKQVQSIVSSLTTFAARAQPGRRNPVDHTVGDRRVRPQASARTTTRYAHAGEEPTLDEVLQDPVIWQRAWADGLELADLQRVLLAAQQR